LVCREKLAVTAIQCLGCGCVPKRMDKAKMKPSGHYSP
jgi:lipoprotein